MVIFFIGLLSILSACTISQFSLKSVDAVETDERKPWYDPEDSVAEAVAQRYKLIPKVSVKVPIDLEAHPPEKTTENLNTKSRYDNDTKKIKALNDRNSKIYSNS